MSYLSRARAAALGLLVAGALFPAAAQAQEAKPTPTSCAGLTFTDPAGDQDFGAVGVSTGIRTQDNLDVTAGFFRYVPEGGKNVLTANIQIANLTSDATPGSTGHTYYFYFQLADGTHFVNADLDTLGNWTFGVGDLGISGTGNTQTGETTGKVYEGPEGIISIVVPVAQLGIEGKSLGTPYASSRVAFSAVVVGLVPTADDGPDSQAGKNYRVSPCIEGGPSGPALPADPGTPQPPTTDPGPGKEPASGPAKLDVTVKAPKLSAKKLRKKPTAIFALDAGEKITGLKARLFRGSASKPSVVATGSLAAAEGGEKLTVKFSKKAVRKLKPGKYTFELTGRKADGRAGTFSVQVTVSK